jgi:hypothetical protein
MTSEIDYFERRGCYELAKALMLDCLHQLARDPQAHKEATQAERRWLMGQHIEDTPVTFAQVVSTLGMDVGGRLHQQLVQIALADPAQGIRMMTSHRVHQAIAELCGPRGPQPEEVCAREEQLEFEFAEETTQPMRLSERERAA